MLLSRRSSCCTPSVQEMTFGATRSGIKLDDFARAAAWVAGGTFVCNSPPPARKPCPESVRAGFQVLHQAGRPASAQVIEGFCSVCNCGGKLLIAKLLGMTSYAIPAPPRIAHLPRPV